MPERAQNMGNCPKKVLVVLTTYKIDIKSVVFSDFFFFFFLLQIMFFHLFQALEQLFWIVVWEG